MKDQESMQDAFKNFQRAKQTIAQALAGQVVNVDGRSFQAVAKALSRVQAAHMVDLEAWELRLLLKVYRPVRGLVRWVKEAF